MGLASRRSAFMEFLISSGYTDVTSYLRQTSPVVITRGKGNEQGKVAPASLAAVMDGTDGFMNPLNPSGQYYTSLRNKNLPGRFGLEHARDFFDRVVVGGWGSTDVRLVASKPAPTVEPWTIGASTADYNVNGGVGKHFIPTPGNQRFSYMANLAAMGNYEIRGDINIPVPASGADTNKAGFLLRGASTADALWVYIRAFFGASAQLTATELATGNTVLNAIMPFSGGNISLVAAVEGRMLFAKAYATGTNEPFDWSFGFMSSATDDFGWAGCQSQSSVATPNLTLTYDNIKVRSYRFAGEIVALKPRSNLAHTDKTSILNMSTAIRRLAKPQAPLSSALRRGVLRGAVQPIAYWPMEEGKSATTFAPAIGTLSIEKDKNPINVTSPKPATNTAFDCSDAIPTFNNASVNAFIPTYDNTAQQFECMFLLAGPNQPNAADNGAGVATIFMSKNAIPVPNKFVGDTQWTLQWHAPTGPLEVFGWLSLFVIEISTNNVLVDTGPFGIFIGQQMNRIRLRMKQNGAAIDWELWVSEVTDITNILGGGFTSGTTAAATLGLAYNIQFGNIGFLSQYGLGHVMAFNQWTSTFYLANELCSWSGERAIDRFIRLCAEEGEPAAYQGATNSGQKMGPQKLKTLLNHLQDCADTEQGELLESLTTGFLMFRTADDLKNQIAKATLNYANKQIGSGFEPDPDDKPTINDVTLKRDGGGVYQVEKATGPMNTQRPGKDPDAAGRNSISPTFSMLSDSQLAQIANFILLRGTNPETRWPKVPVTFQSENIVASSTELSVLAINIDDFFKITNLSNPWGVPDPLQLMSIGYTETWLDEFLQGIVFNTAPYSPYRVFILDTNRLDTDTSKLTSDITNSQTSVSVTDTSGGRWATTASEPAEFPFGVTVDGELMTVTAIVGGASPQTFTVTRSVNGVVNTHKANAKVVLVDPIYLG